ncbi:xanthine dehydrogenase/oxidase-like isoform X1 [Penaeus chinensis]|uniref:xanthine dehydrogenase/oxidase-like isoform X1 n=1 Tax=Penaeus chinensis TaxID=139456 RepID=UPI001FB7955C|nr:xanthine dehydrogenase/oxidase-like isoform X1 [Penaeus chinensis]
MLVDVRWSNTLVFFVNGKKVREPNVDPEMTLLTFLREKLRLCGTKSGCGEGGCGACTVMASKYDRGRDEVRHYSIVACLIPVAAVHGLAVTTVEGIGSTQTRLHAVQERIARAHGSQCGFCTPGIVMSMYTLLRNHPKPSMEQLDEYFTGNLCRCTGYRPILEGYRGLTTDASAGGGCGRKDCCKLRTQGCQEGTTSNEVSDGISNGDISDVSRITDISHVLYDAEDFRPYDPSQELIFPPELKTQDEWDSQYLEFKGARVSYVRPVSLAQLLDLKAEHPEARIVAGNTEVGIDVKFKNKNYPVLLNPTIIPELTEVSVTQAGVTFGSSVTLSDIEGTLREQVNTQPEYRTRSFSAILEMLRWFGGKQIRNVATLGGNIMTSSPISDLNPLLAAAGAKLTAQSKEKGKREVAMDQNFFTGYRQNAVRPEEILVAVHIPYTEQNEYFLGYKQARRRDDDIAIVNAGMRVAFRKDSLAVAQLRLAFGGMAPTTVMALATMEELEGRCWDPSLLEAGTSLLLQDLPLSASAPGGMVEYRRALAISFFFKFYLSVRGRLSEQFPSLVDPLTEAEQKATKVHRYIPPKGTQLFQSVPPGQPSLDPIGRPITHTSAFKHATGEAVYVDDIPPLKDELQAAPVVSSRAHARILSIDEEAALSMEGVEGFFCWKDLPEERNRIGPITADEELFASKSVNCVGQLIGLVVAKDRATAQRAAKAVKIQYEDIKPCIITIQDAINEQSWWTPFTIKKGDIEEGFRSSQHILEGEMHVGGQEHFYLETHTHLAVPKGEDGGMEMFSATQNAAGTQRHVAAALGVPLNLVTCRVKRLGGGFGGKETRNNMLSVPIAIAAAALKRPVRISLDREEDMLMTGGRHPLLGRWKIGFTDEGIFKAIQMDLYLNGGCSLDLSAAVTGYAMLNHDSVYRCENRQVTGYPCKTNLPSNTAFRAFGSPQAIIITEYMVSRVAEFLNMDPDEVRLKNMYVSGDETHYKQTLERCTVRRCWDEVVSQADYHTRREVVRKFNSSNKYTKRGIAALPLKFGIGFTELFLNQAGALVHVYTDGSVLLSHGGTEMGQGLHTKMIQVASSVLKIPVTRIYIDETSTDKVPNASSTAASLSSDLYGMAVLNACNTIMQRLEPYMASNPKGGWDEWVKAAYFDRVSLSATGFYKTPGISGYNFETNEGRPFSYFCFGAAVTEVEVDCLTGHHSVLRTDIVMDVGDSLNPAIDIGQVEGAFMQGLGLYTLEELRYSPEGVLLTRGPGTYKIPGFQDIPREFNVSLLRGAPNPRAVFSSKAVGEPPLLLATSVFYAIKQAVASARADQGFDPVFRLDSPATAERIRISCQDPLTQKIEPAVLDNERPWSVTV